MTLRVSFRPSVCSLLLVLIALVHAYAQQKQASDRKELPDPFLEIWDQAVAAMDLTYGDWKRNEERSVGSTEYTIEYLSSVYPDSRRRLDATLLMQADQNRDKWVSREESKRFLEIQLGIRWETDDLLRHEDGRVVDFAAFMQVDTNRDSKLSAAEQADTKVAGLSSLDQNADGAISLAEFSSRESPFLRDPVEAFRSADTDSDQALNAAELLASVSGPRRHLVRSNLAAFDENQDQRLSLTEYRVSMLGNFNYPWQTIPIDQNRDRRLTFKEFRFDDRSLFQLQRRFYFHRLDLNRDGQLSLDEFWFETSKLQALVRVSTSGSERKQIFSEDDYPVVGSPDVSPDGHLLLFDAGPPQAENQAVIRIMTIDGQDPRDVCDGAMPSWSADGRRFACSRQAGAAGVWIMNLDGSAEKRIDDGWGAQWSPDGKWIAYTNDNSLQIYEVGSGITRTLLAKGSHPYRYIFWNMAWSPDSRRLVFKGKLDDQQSEVGIVDIDDADLSRRFRSAVRMGEDFAWTTDGQEVLFPMQSKQTGRQLVYRMVVDAEDSPTGDVLAGDEIEVSSICFSRDGEWMILATTNEG